MVAGDVISMPDKWEYPWFAAWDLAFHCAPLSLVDIDFAKQQVELLLSTRYLHPNGQIPAYEWNFSDVNPPVTAWAALFVFEREARDPRRGRPRVPRARLRTAADELHLVGQPQGPRRQRPLPGRLPGPRQHRDLRPLGAAAGGWHARAGRRHGVDGPLLPVDAADRGRARQTRPRLRRHRAQVRQPLRVDRDRARPAGRPRRAVGRGGRLLLRRHADAGRQHDPAQGALARRAASDVRGDRVRRGRHRPPPGVRGARGRVHRALLRRGSRARPPSRAQPRGPPPPQPRRRGAAAADPRERCSTRRSSSARTGSARSHAGTSSTRACSTGRGSATRSTTCPPSRTRACSAATRTGAAPCGSR